MSWTGIEPGTSRPRSGQSTYCATKAGQSVNGRLCRMTLMQVSQFVFRHKYAFILSGMYFILVFLELMFLLQIITNLIRVQKNTTIIMSTNYN